MIDMQINKLFFEIPNSILYQITIENHHPDHHTRHCPRLPSRSWFRSDCRRDLYHSQRELASTHESADLEYYLRPTFDFRQELLSQAHEAEVLVPESLRQEMKELLAKMMERYE